MSTYLYMYESWDRKKVYIGIGDSMERVWGRHNDDADELRNEDGTRILQTVKPFPDRDSALKAEAIAIHVAMLGGRTVKQITDQETDEEENDSVEQTDGGLVVTNRAETVGTVELGPAILVTGKTVKYSELKGTVMVPIDPDPDNFNNRPGPSSHLSGAEFSERAGKWWNLGAFARRDNHAHRLLAVLKGRHIILGSWELKEPWAVQDPEFDSSQNWQFVMVDPDVDDVDGLKGALLDYDTGYQLGQSVTYSPDLSPSGRPSEA